MNEIVEQYYSQILPVLLKNKMPKEPAILCLSMLADNGREEMRVRRLKELKEYLDEGNGIITPMECCEVAFGLVEKYPD